LVWGALKEHFSSSDFPVKLIIPTEALTFSVVLDIILVCSEIWCKAWESKDQNHLAQHSILKAFMAAQSENVNRDLLKECVHIGTLRKCC
jgi:hypothetical protein